MIITRLEGGLGNQLFQYACGRALANFHNTSLKLDITNFFFEMRVFELHEYAINATIARAGSLIHYTPYNALISIIQSNSILSDSQIIYEGMKFLNQLRTKRRTTNNGSCDGKYYPPLINDKFVAERFLHYDSDFCNVGNNVYIMGYWQSEKYFKNIRQILLHELSLKQPFQNDISDIIMQKNSVSIHIRRGDKVDSDNYFCTDISYIHKAINHIKDIILNPVFFVFSDDPTWVSHIFKTESNMFFIQGNQPYQDIHLMSLCKHNIIAESSFSWWGAWLNKNDNKVVIAPDPLRWNKKYHDVQDLYPKEWIIFK